MHRREQNLLEEGLKIMPPGVTLWGRIFSRINSVFLPFIRIPPTEVDVVLDAAFVKHLATDANCRGVEYH